MQIDYISNNTFQGKFKVSKFLNKKEKTYANQILEYNLDGITNKKYLAKKNSDIDIYSTNSKRTVNPKLKFYVSMDYLSNEWTERGDSKIRFFGQAVRMDEKIESGAKMLRAFIDSTEDYRSTKMPTQYNNCFQKLLLKTKMFFRII